MRDATFGVERQNPQGARIGVCVVIERRTDGDLGRAVVVDVAHVRDRPPKGVFGIDVAVEVAFIVTDLRLGENDGHGRESGARNQDECRTAKEHGAEALSHP